MEFVNELDEDQIKIIRKNFLRDIISFLLVFNSIRIKQENKSYFIQPYFEECVAFLASSDILQNYSQQHICYAIKLDEMRKACENYFLELGSQHLSKVSFDLTYVLYDSLVICAETCEHIEKLKHDQLLKFEFQLNNIYRIIDMLWEVCKLTRLVEFEGNTKSQTNLQLLFNLSRWFETVPTYKCLKQLAQFIVFSSAKSYVNFLENLIVNGKCSSSAIEFDFIINESSLKSENVWDNLMHSSRNLDHRILPEYVGSSLLVGAKSIYLLKKINYKHHFLQCKSKFPSISLPIETSSMNSIVKQTETNINEFLKYCLVIKTKVCQLRSAKKLEEYRRKQELIRLSAEATTISFLRQQSKQKKLLEKRMQNQINYRDELDKQIERKEEDLRIEKAERIREEKKMSEEKALKDAGLPLAQEAAKLFIDERDKMIKYYSELMSEVDSKIKLTESDIQRKIDKIEEIGPFEINPITLGTASSNMTSDIAFEDPKPGLSIDNLLKTNFDLPEESTASAIELNDQMENLENEVDNVDRKDSVSTRGYAILQETYDVQSDPLVELCRKFARVNAQSAKRHDELTSLMLNKSSETCLQEVETLAKNQLQNRGYEILKENYNSSGVLNSLMRKHDVFKEINTHGHPSDSTVEHILYPQGEITGEGKVDVPVDVKTEDFIADVLNQKKVEYKMEFFSIQEHYRLGSKPQLNEFRKIILQLEHVSDDEDAIEFSRNSLRSQDVANQMSVSDVWDQCLARPLMVFAEQANFALLDCLCHDFPLLPLVQTMRDCFLLHNGLITETLLATKNDEISILSSKNWCKRMLDTVGANFSQLREVLETSAMTLDLHSIKKPPEPHLWKWRLCGELKWPLSICFRRHHMDRLSDVFTHIMCLKDTIRACNEVSLFLKSQYKESFRHLDRSCRGVVGRGITSSESLALVHHPKVLTAMHETQLMHNEIVQVMRGLDVYFGLHVLMPEGELWLATFACIQSADDSSPPLRPQYHSVRNLGDLIDHTDQFITRITSKCFLRPEDEELCSVLYSLYECVHRFRVLLTGGTWLVQGIVNSSKCPPHSHWLELKSTFETFRSHTRFLCLRITRMSNSLMPYSESLRQLVTCFSMNDFYTDLIF